MRAIITLLSILCFSSSVLCLPVGGGGSVRLNGWEDTKLPAHPQQETKFTVLLKQRNMRMLEDMFWDISDPHSSNYGKYLGQEQITALVAPEKQVVDDVRKWIESVPHRGIKLVAHRDAFIVNSTVEATERLFGIKLSQFRNPGTKKVLLRSASPVAVPAHLLQHVDFVTALNEFPHVRAPPPALASRSELASNAPIINTTVVLNGVLYIAFFPVCKDGSLTPEAENAACGQTNTPATTATISVTPTYPSNTFNTFNVNASYFGQVCSWNADLQNWACVLPCSGPHYPLPNIFYTISVQVSYSDGSTSSVGAYPYYVLNAPYSDPLTIKSIYGIPLNLTVTNSSITQGFAGFNGQYINSNDINQFLTSYNLPSVSVSINGYNNPANPGSEATLDVEMETSIAPGAPTTFVSIEQGESTVDWAVLINDLSNPPLVNSVSYGNGEYAQIESTYARADNEFIIMGLQGLSVLVSSGDGGASSLNYYEGSCNVALPDWPASSPYVTAVGATTLTKYTQANCFPPNAIDCSSNAVGEITTSTLTSAIITSGGGFSILYSKRPSFQTDFVSQYLSTIGSSIPSGFTSSTSGRAYPDIAAVGHNLPTVISGEVTPVDGTSASSPIAAGIITLLNSVRAASGLPPLGYLNPILYQIKRDHPTAFNDITIGNNSCGTSDYPCCNFGYPATTGWDAVTGLGSINYAVMSSVINNYAPQPVVGTTSGEFSSLASSVLLPPQHQLVLVVMVFVALWCWML